jgi:ubiquinone/menaquinone biosynthesis C-methylase UbiE
MSDAQLKSLEMYARLMRTNAAAHVFRAAVELGVFDALGEGQKDAGQIAADCGGHPEPVGLLLDALCTIGVVEKYGDLFALAPVMHLLPQELRDLGDRYWQHLAAFVRTAQPIPQLAASSLDEADFHLEAAASEWMMTPAALDVVQLLGIGSERAGLQILELAAGSAVWSLAIAHRDPQCHLTLVDHPRALAAARAHSHAIGLSDQVDWVEGDYRTVELPAERFDLVILAGAVNLETLEDNTAYFRRIYPWLRPGGELAVISVFAGQAKGTDQYALYRLALALRTDRGRVHGPEQLQAALLEAGFDKPQFAHLPSPPHVMGLMLAAKGP